MVHVLWPRLQCADTLPRLTREGAEAARVLEKLLDSALLQREGAFPSHLT